MNMSFVSKKWVWGGLAAVVVVGVIVVRGGESVEARYEFATIERADIRRAVDVSGIVRPIEYVDLSFEQSGRVSGVYVRAGDRVRVGEVLASLSHAAAGADVAAASARVELEEARRDELNAVVEAARIKLEELLNGSRPEEVEIKRAAWNTAVIDFSKTITDTSLVRDDAFDDVRYSVEVTLAPLFVGQQGTSYELAYTTCDVQRASDVAWERFVVGGAIGSYAFGDVHTDADAVAELTRILSLVQQAEDFVAQVSVTLSDDCTRSDTTLGTHRAAVDTARSRLQSARGAILAHRQLLSTKRNARDVADADLRLAQIGPRPEVIAAQESAIVQAKASLAQQEASVKQAQAARAQAQARASEYVILSPIAGVITKHDVRVGQFVSPQKQVLRVAADGAFEVEVFVPELDIAEVAIGAPVIVTLDAYGDDVSFSARVYSIESAETLLEGVPTYKTVIHFDGFDERVASGMTANVEIVVDERDDVIVAPVRAVQREGDRQFIRRLDGEGVVEADVAVGLKGSDGRVEIIRDDVSEGDRVILFEK